MRLKLYKDLMKKIVLKILLILFCLPLAANENSAAIDSANACYSRGEYEKAIELYKSVIDNGYEAAELYYNLGNTCYKSNKITYAILYYERAKLLDPFDEDIDYNLEMAEKLVIDKIDIIPELFINTWIKQTVDMFSTNMWAVISIVVFVIFLLLFSVFLYSRIILLKKISFWIGILALMVSITAFTFSYKQKENITNRNTAIIFTPAVTVKSSPDDSGTDLFLIHEGTKITVTDALGEWVEIRLSDGNVGWLKASDLTLI